MSSYGNVTEFMHEHVQQLDIAGVCYEALRQYMKTQGLTEVVVPWENASAHTKATMVKMINDRNEARTMTDAKKITFEQAHNDRVIKRAGDGWVYGPVYDAEKLTDPNMCSYDELPVHMKVADALVGAILDVLTDPKYKTV